MSVRPILYNNFWGPRTNEILNTIVSWSLPHWFCTSTVFALYCFKKDTSCWLTGAYDKQIAFDLCHCWGICAEIGQQVPCPDKQAVPAVQKWNHQAQVQIGTVAHQCQLPPENKRLGWHEEITALCTAAVSCKSTTIQSDIPDESIMLDNVCKGKSPVHAQE